MPEWRRFSKQQGNRLFWTEGRFGGLSGGRREKQVFRKKFLLLGSADNPTLQWLFHNLFLASKFKVLPNITLGTEFPQYTPLHNLFDYFQNSRLLSESWFTFRILAKNGLGTGFLGYHFFPTLGGGALEKIKFSFQIHTRPLLSKTKKSWVEDLQRQCSCKIFAYSTAEFGPNMAAVHKVPNMEALHKVLFSSALACISYTSHHTDETFYSVHSHPVLLHRSNI